MAQNMGFGSALTGFGTGYLNALRQGRSEQNSLISAKLRKDALDQKKQEASAAGLLRSMQMEDLIDARRDRRDAAKDRAQNATNKLLFGANAKVADFYTRMQPVISTMDPAQRKTTHDSMRTSVRGMLIAGGMKPEDADGYAESLIKPYGMQLQDETVDVNLGPDMTKEGLMSSGTVPQSSVNRDLGFGALAPGESTDWKLQPDGSWGRVGVHSVAPQARAYAGLQNYLSDPFNNILSTLQGGRDPKAGGFQQFADSTIGSTEQRQGITKTVPATATYGIDAKNQSIIDRNKASTKLTEVKTQQLVDLFPDQANLLRKKAENLAASIGLTKERTKFISLNYDLDLRKLAAQTAYQQAMTSIQSGQLNVAQQNLALRKVGMRMNQIIQPSRIAANAGAIIADLTKARELKGANKPLLDQQIARLNQLQKNMKTFEVMSTQTPQDLANANNLAQVFGEGLEGLGILGQLSGLSPNTDVMRQKFYGEMAPPNIWNDPYDYSDEDYYMEQDIFGNHPLAYPGQAARGFNTGATGGSGPIAPNGRGLRFGP